MISLRNYIENYYIYSVNPDTEYDYKYALYESRKNKNLLIDFNEDINDVTYNEWKHKNEILTKEERLNNRNKIILETLNSYSANEFLKAIKKATNNFENNAVQFKSLSNDSLDIPTSVEIYIKFTDKSIDFLSKKYLNKILDICKFYRYYITAHFEHFLKYKFDVICFEPLDTKEITKDIKENFGSKFYHLTKKRNLEKIKKYGLYVSGVHPYSSYENPVWYIKQKEIFTHKNLKGYYDENIIRDSIRNTMKYRNFPDRTFIYYTNEDPIDAGMIMMNKIKKNENPNDYCIIEFNLKGHNNPLFKDSIMKDIENIYFGYSNIDIPKELIVKTFELRR